MAETTPDTETAETGQPEARDEVDGAEFEAVAEVVHGVIASLEGDITGEGIKLHAELEQMVRYIRNAKREISDIRPLQIKSRDIPGATDQLDAIVKMTEEATNTILSAVEELGELAETLPPEVAAKLNEISTRVFEASNFQDITGQRVSKVIATLRYIEEKLGNLAAALGHTDDGAEPVEEQVADDVIDENELLDGPQLPDHANTQEEIDALLASFD